MFRGYAGLLAGLAVAGLVLAGCGGDDDDDGDDSKQITIGNLTFADKGTEEAAGDKQLELEADDFYFSPTFLRGDPGQKLKLVISNESANTHNFNTGSGGLDKDIARDAKVEIEVTFPASGGLVFFCKYHSKDGMNGGLLVGKASTDELKASAEGPQPGTDYGY